jgi:phosphotransferase system  glucose/maltose/N-acetylglucosamine-specific IIC component
MRKLILMGRRKKFKPIHSAFIIGILIIIVVIVLLRKVFWKKEAKSDGEPDSEIEIKRKKKKDVPVSMLGPKVNKRNISKYIKE